MRTSSQTRTDPETTTTKESTMSTTVNTTMNTTIFNDTHVDGTARAARPATIDSPVVPLARCADGNGTLTPLFFSDHIIDIARAKAICGKCELSRSCLADALDREEPWGVWGGELLSMGRIVRVKRPCGRPPKRPRPELVIDEMGVVA